MSNEIMSHSEMCHRENRNLQAGMHFGCGPNYSVLLMSVRRNAPYRDRLEDGGTTLVYEGHDQPRSTACPDPKAVDQPERLQSGLLTQNGKFHQAAQQFKRNERTPERVRVYEKIMDGVWSYSGMFHLVDSWHEKSGPREVFKFKLVAIEGEEDRSIATDRLLERRRIIPTEVKRTVWERDGGRCVRCGANDEIHFDHILPWSKGGTSITADNVQILCARHNLEKSDKII